MAYTALGVVHVCVGVRGFRSSGLLVLATGAATFATSSWFRHHGLTCMSSGLCSDIDTVAVLSCMAVVQALMLLWLLLVWEASLQTALFLSACGSVGPSWHEVFSPACARQLLVVLRRSFLKHCKAGFGHVKELLLNSLQINWAGDCWNDVCNHAALTCKQTSAFCALEACKVASWCGQRAHGQRSMPWQNAGIKTA